MAAVAPAAQTGVPATTPILPVQGLDKVYPTGQHALAGVDVTIERPQVVAIIGPSGAGKSTFIRCINRLVEPTAGRILLHGQDIVTLDRRGLPAARRRLRLILPEIHLIQAPAVNPDAAPGRPGFVVTRGPPAVPVSAHAITSLPSSASGMTALWIGQVSLKPRSRTPSSSRRSRLSDVNGTGVVSQSVGSSAAVSGTCLARGRGTTRRA